MQLRHRGYFQTCHMPAVNTFHLLTNSAVFKTVDNLKLGFSSVNLCIVYDLNKIFGLIITFPTWFKVYGTLISSVRPLSVV